METARNNARCLPRAEAPGERRPHASERVLIARGRRDHRPPKSDGLGTSDHSFSSASIITIELPRTT